MYEETKSSIDWKGLFLKVIIVFLVILIGITAYNKLFKSNNKENNQNNNNVEISDSKNSATFTSNMEKLRTSGKNYFEKNKDSLPTKTGTTTIVTLNELIEKGYITELKDENGNVCDKESSYVTATLDGDNTKIKANLVCGEASSYSLVYMNNNESIKEEESTTSNKTSTSTSTSSNKTTSTNTSNNTSSSTTSSNSSSTTTTNTNTSTTDNKTTCNNNCQTSTCTSNCVPSVTVNTNVNQTVTINKPATTTTKPVTQYYTVKFDSNGGDTIYSNKIVEANKTVSNPGTPKKTLNGKQCTFKGWYLNGSKYDFSTPVNKNFTLVANYSCPATTYYTVIFDSNGGNPKFNNQIIEKNDKVTEPNEEPEKNVSGYTCTFNGWYYNNEKYDFDTPVTKNMTLEAEYRCVKKQPELVTKTMTTTVYTMGWDTKGAKSLKISHTLRVPEELESLDVEKVRIKNITYAGAIDSLSEANKYADLHESTFLYTYNGWEYRDFSSYQNFTNISKSDVVFAYLTTYKTYNNALSNGFKVLWGAEYLTNDCDKTFSVNGISNLCAFGIYYKVTWEYQVYEY